MNSMNGTFMGIANSQKKPPRFDQETIQAGQCMCKVLFRSGD